MEPRPSWAPGATDRTRSLPAPSGTGTIRRSSRCSSTCGPAGRSATRTSSESLAGAPVEAGLTCGVGSAAGAPIVVGGEPWGHIGLAMAKGRPLPDGVEERLAEITELVATVIANNTTREQVERLADEQAALRRVATLVARGAPPAGVFDAVAEEVGRLLDVGSSGVVRFEDEHVGPGGRGMGPARRGRGRSARGCRSAGTTSSPRSRGPAAPRASMTSSAPAPARSPSARGA